MLALLWHNIKHYLKEYIILDGIVTLITFLAWYFFKDNLNIFIVLIIFYMAIDVYVGFNSGKQNELDSVIALFIVLILYQFLTYQIIKLVYPPFKAIRLLFSWYSMTRLSAFPYLIASFLGWKNY